MSRIGKQPIEIPNGVSVVIDGNSIRVDGPKGSLTQDIPQTIEIVEEDKQLLINIPEEYTKQQNIDHGLFRSLIANMVEGVTEGFSKTLVIEGTGYRASKQAKTLVLNLGFSHQVKMEDPDGIETEVPNDRTIIVKGYDKQLVGLHAANIRKWRKPEPYKGKGIRYEDEYVRRKVGKTGK